jgi:hypothetical protein
MIKGMEVIIKATLNRLGAKIALQGQEALTEQEKNTLEKIGKAKAEGQRQRGRSDLAETTEQVIKKVRE